MEGHTLLMEHDDVTVPDRVDANVDLFIVRMLQERLDYEVLEGTLSSFYPNRLVDAVLYPTMNRCCIAVHVNKTKLAPPLDQLVRLHHKSLINDSSFKPPMPVASIMVNNIYAL